MLGRKIGYKTERTQDGLVREGLLKLSSEGWSALTGTGWGDLSLPTDLLPSPSTTFRTQGREPPPAAAWSALSWLQSPDLIRQGERAPPSWVLWQYLSSKDPAHGICGRALSGPGEGASRQQPSPQQPGNAASWQEQSLLPDRQGLWNGCIKNDCGNKVLLAIWNNGALSRARRLVADGCRQMCIEKGSEGQELVTVWDGGQLEGDTSYGQSEWQGTGTLQRNEF